MTTLSIVTYILGFLFGVGQMVDINLVGRITLADFVVWIPMPIYLYQTRHIIFSKKGALILFALACYLASLLITNWLTHNPFFLSLRGFLRVFFMGGYMIFFIWLLQTNPKALWAVILGAALGSPIIMLRPGAWLEESANSEGYGLWASIYSKITLSVVIFVSCFAYNFSRTVAIVIILVSTTVLSPFVPRSETLIGFATALILTYLAISHSGHLRSFQKLTPGRLVFFGCLGCMGLLMIYFMYIYAAPAGILGHYQQEKFYAQTSTEWGVTPWGLVLSGRTEFVAATMAVRDHPIIGMGSWNSFGWAPYLVDALRLGGANVSSNAMGGFYGSYYSHHATFLGEWAEAGIGAMIFWAITVYCSVKVLFNIIRYDNVFAPYIISALLYFYWNLMFSPLNISLRIGTGLVLALYLLLYAPRSPLFPFSFAWLPRLLRNQLPRAPR
ncbi:hypothetical protein H5P28_15205 [Ruficoccus amylovorans]|uniref:Uncharacterized protein n=1 Tax=Ruficoccus amylovorans TaxID=1804625 RepID=A0A842HJ24_9BACT|nr:hypothetical protein [Ruficoccus amylovorans]MBC2595614.1 hypothetical protein [Ruficoccus amylovorans]